MSSNWPTYRCDSANTGVTDDVGPASDYIATWTNEVGFCGGHEMVVADGRVVTTLASGVMDGTVRAFESASGTHLWSGPDDLKDRYTAATVAGDLVWATNLDDQPMLEAFDSTGGALVHQYDVPGVNYSDVPPVVAGETVYAGTLSRLRAFDTEGNGQLWEYESNAEIRGAPAVVDGTVYLGIVEQTGDTEQISDRGRLGRIEPSVLALDTIDGSINWRQELPGAPHAPVVRDGSIFCLTHAFDYGGDPHEGYWVFNGSDESITETDLGALLGVVVALDATDGSLLWTVRLDTEVSSLNGLAVGEDDVYVGIEEGEVRCLATETGSTRWTTSLSASVGHPPSVDSEAVYVGTGDGVVAMGRDVGDVRWRFDTPDIVNTSVSVCDGTAFFGDRTGRVYALDEG